MKKSLFLGLALTSLLATTSCSDNKGNAETSTVAGSATATDSAATPSAANSSDATAAVYTCSMDPEVAANQPGKCPKCGMDLVKK